MTVNYICTRNGNEYFCEQPIVRGIPLEKFAVSCDGCNGGHEIVVRRAKPVLRNIILPVAKVRKFSPFEAALGFL
jgi:hypothetical protein